MTLSALTKSDCGNFIADRYCPLHVHDQFEHSRLRDRQIGTPDAAENLINERAHDAVFS